MSKCILYLVKSFPVNQVLKISKSVWGGENLYRNFSACWFTGLDPLSRAIVPGNGGSAMVSGSPSLPSTRRSARLPWEVLANGETSPSLSRGLPLGCSMVNCSGVPVRGISAECKICRESRSRFQTGPTSDPTLGTRCIAASAACRTFSPPWLTPGEDGIEANSRKMAALWRFAELPRASENSPSSGASPMCPETAQIL